ncbi:WxL domain-containing protein, partial [Enterococcus casseliflavus]|uniref:WxL domain-containing protein n=1 Tax=Enterococcus casseliflavus TaxID=37734 RepID=UPI0039A4EDBC
MNFRKRVALYGVLCFFIHLFPFTIVHVHAQEQPIVDEEIVEAFRLDKPEYLSISTSKNKVENQVLNQPTEPTQEFSFVHKTFRTTIDQSILVQFTSKLPADQVLIRVPKEGRVLTTHFSKGELVEHSHGEYWTLKTQAKQTEFELPVVFDSDGQYFLTIDHDADNFYLEVETNNESNQSKEDNTQGTEGLSVEDEHYDIEGHGSTEETNQKNSSLLNVVEHHLPVSEDLLEIEDARVLEETRDPQDRSTSNVRNWAQFRSAWDSSSTTRIVVHQNIRDTDRPVIGERLTRRDQSIIIESHGLIDLNQTLGVNGSANLEIRGPRNRGTHLRVITSGSNANVISHNGTGTVLITDNAEVQGNIFVRNISFQNGGVKSSRTMYQDLEIPSNGSLEIQNVETNLVTGILDSRILIFNNVTANIRGNNVEIRGKFWNSGDIQLNGNRGRNIVSAITDPDDFAQVYRELFSGLYTGPDNRESIIVNGDKVRPSYSLSFQGSPSQGGNPTAQSNTIQEGTRTTINANPNPGYNFVHWEIVSGTGSSIESVTAETTTFTMGSQNAVVRAIYEETRSAEVHVYHTDRLGHDLIEPEILTGSIGEDYQTEPANLPNYQLIETPDNATGTFTNETISVVYVYDIESVSPADPLDPETEVDPENKPELPEGQGLLSIDFVSNFIFGSQVISAHDQTYYAQPQRLVNEDQSINEDEERPNYIQVSDRRSENERNGWQLAVTQKDQFSTDNNNELVGAQLQLMNQQLVTAQGGKEPSLQATNPLKLVPGNKRTLVRAEGAEGTGTWLYRFGNADSA